MTASRGAGRTGARAGRLSAARQVVRAAVLVGLGVVAYVHLLLAGDYGLIGEQISLGALFRLQAAAALLVAVLLVLPGGRLPALAAAALGAASLVALVGSVYVNVPPVGPFPPVYEPIWFPSKVAATLGAAVALVGGLLLLRRPATR